MYKKCLKLSFVQITPDIFTTFIRNRASEENLSIEMLRGFVDLVWALWWDGQPSRRIRRWWAAAAAAARERGSHERRNRPPPVAASIG